MQIIDNCCVVFLSDLKVKLLINATMRQLMNVITSVYLFLQAFFVTGQSNGYKNCAEWMQKNPFDSLTNGVFHIYSESTDKYTSVYCNFDYIHNYSFTLIESASLSNMQNLLSTAPFTANVTYNMNDVYNFRHSLYRLTQQWMLDIESNSNLLFSTCNFDTTFSQDWLLIDLDSILSNANPFYYSFFEVCYDIVSLDIRGNECFSNTITMNQINIPSSYPTDNINTGRHMYIKIPTESSYIPCGCETLSSGIIAIDINTGEDNFGYYSTINTNFSCSMNSSSTTNWWLGSNVNSFLDSGKVPTRPPHSPTNIPSNDPATPIFSAGPTQTPQILMTPSGQGLQTTSETTVGGTPNISSSNINNTYISNSSNMTSNYSYSTSYFNYTDSNSTTNDDGDDDDDFNPVQAEFDRFGQNLVLIIIMTGVSITIMAKLYQKCQNSSSEADYFKSLGAFFMMADFISDISFALILYFEDSADNGYSVQLFWFCSSCIVLSHIISCCVGMYWIQTWRTQQEMTGRLIKYLSQYETLFIALIVGCGFYTAIELLQSKLFYLYALNLPLKNEEYFTIQYIRFLNTVMFENIAQLIIQIIYITTNNDSRVTPIVFVSMGLSVFSIVRMIFAQIARVCKLYNPQQNNFAHKVVLTGCLIIKCTKLKKYHAFGNKNIEISILDMLHNCQDSKMRQIWMRSDLSINIECFYIHQSIKSFYLMKSYIVLTVLTHNIGITKTLCRNLQAINDQEHGNNILLTQALCQLLKINTSSSGQDHGLAVSITNINMQSFNLSSESVRIYPKAKRAKSNESEMAQLQLDHDRNPEAEGEGQGEFDKKAKSDAKQGIQEYGIGDTEFVWETPMVIINHNYRTSASVYTVDTPTGDGITKGMTAINQTDDS